VYGRADSLPVSESHLVRPADVNGINKAAGEYYHLLYNNVFGIRACSLRLTNVYGPRQLLKHNRQGFIAWFIRLAIEIARFRSTVTARSGAISCTWTMPRTRSCARAPMRRATARC
jgi:nucleoside-diphosphate-sugar epimerase